MRERSLELVFALIAGAIVGVIGLQLGYEAHQRQAAAYAAGNEVRITGKRQASSTPSPNAENIASEPKWWERQDLEAQQSMVSWTRITTFITSVGLLLLGWTLLETRRAVEQAKAANEATAHLVGSEMAPFVTVRVVNGANYRWIVDKGGVGLADYAEGTSPVASPLWINISNEGKAPVRIKAIARQWSVGGTDVFPAALDPMSEDTKVKHLSVPIGPQAKSVDLRSFSGDAPAGNMGDWLYFHGFVRYTDFAGVKEFAAGFLYAYNTRDRNLGIHTALPTENSEQYWYHRELT